MNGFKQDRINFLAMDRILNDIRLELDFAMKKFAEFPTDPIHAVAVIAEESGEAIKDALQWTYEPEKNKSAETLRKELIQTCAMCIRTIAGIDSGNINPEGG